MVEELEGLIDLTKENVLTPSGGIQGGNVKLNVGHHRMRAIYWRELSDGSWVQTAPLPADPESQTSYFRRGFRARPPDTKPVEAKSSETLSCPTCGFEAQSAFGLQAHQRKHKK